jgi:hypothetical protein
MYVPLLPVEVLLMIVGEIFSSQESFRPVSYHIDRPLHQALRTQRLAWFRSLASVCKTWIGLARAAFWTEVTLFTVQELIDFAHAVEEPSAKPSCLRRLYFRFPSYPQRNYSPSDFGKVAKEAQRSCTMVLRRLPVHLDVLLVNCDNRHWAPDDILYHSLQAACREHTLTIDVTKLDIDSPPGICDIFTYFAFARNIVHLVLGVTCHDRWNAFSTPMPSMQLESLVLHMQFAGGTAYRLMTVTAMAVTSVLGPACTKLQSLSLNLYGYDDSDENTRIETLNHVLSLCGPSVSVLNLCAKPAYEFIPIAQELADGNAFPRFPMLLRLHLDEFNVSPDIFRGMGCFELRHLEVTVTETSTPSARDGVETMRDLLASVELNELGNLEDLVINFGRVETGEQDSPPQSTVGPWIGTELAWKPLEVACAARNIACVIQHPE